MSDHDDHELLASREGDDARDEFVHDLKNVMAGVLGHLGSIRRRAEAGQAVSDSLGQVENILRGACRMAEDILDVTESGEVREISLVDVVSACAGICVPLEGVELRVRWEGVLPMTSVDGTRLRHVFNNVFTNAVRAMGGAGRIDVTLTREKPDRRTDDPRVLRVSIDDDGPGVPPELRERIFERGFTTSEEGTGVGLYSARQWLRSVGGEIACEAAPGGSGCRMVVLVPGSPSDDARTIPLTVAPRLSESRVLVLEDDEMVRETLGEMLDHLGYPMIATGDGHRTIEVFEKAFAAGEKFALVVLDLNVPGGLGGMETASALRRIDPDVRMVLSSGQEAGPMRGDPRNNGFVGLLKKPYSLEELSALLSG